MKNPRPFFDTLECLNESTHECVKEIINETKIDEVQQEYELSKRFLLSYGGSLDTYTAYRREVERILQWCWLIKEKPIKNLNRDDIREFLEFSNNPPKNWIVAKNVTRFIWKLGLKEPNPEWKPYVVKISKSDRMDGKVPNKKNYQMSNSSIQAIMSILSTYFNFLIQEGYIEGNPIALLRQKKRFLQKTQQLKVTRKLSRTQWLTVIGSAEKLAQKNTENERMLFMMSAFFLLGLRISELAETPGRIPKMGDFAPDKEGLWWFTTIGKGNKIRDVAVSDEMIDALKRYRKSLGLSPLPPRNDTTPLLMKIKGKDGLGTRQVRNLVQTCFNHAVLKLKADGKNDESEDLANATVHWLRHTAISSDVEFRPRQHVRDDAGHGSAITTDRYIDIDRAERHHSAQHKKLRPVDST